MTPSLANFLWSLVWGTAIVVIPATVGLILVSQADKIRR
ncbi:MAG: Photosystem II reaction center X protein [Cyanobacteria bacterium]|jgi:photosystem II PsbX protein|nr:Photosystem II reaction center X protein [Cyanobacteria bacterium CG_2015-16_32_12]NCO78112.1 Photosystem II reaction center X protein [Cyanobacteria bacterium CG_2015-22_32_23]NCQ03157.1 Photosystem II reaction center X protein [Cyanobacteria bacterium CG_2015-09_32_10]NCQ42646.1 Photosystem II reaction center X protein [Cyanobacteria bacterium CG_2015-04_32_10]NCS84026.1 Photosystem II reaction center X protein [Cyanobacteria bacterium CG_2015-02_32_10]